MSLRFGQKDGSLQELIVKARNLKGDSKRIILEEGDYYFDSPIRIKPKIPVYILNQKAGFGYLGAER